MGAPPGAPGAMGEPPTLRVLDLAATGPNERWRRNTITVDAPDITPRAAVEIVRANVKMSAVFSPLGQAYMLSYLRIV